MLKEGRIFKLTFHIVEAEDHVDRLAVLVWSLYRDYGCAPGYDFNRHLVVVSQGVGLDFDGFDRFGVTAAATAVALADSGEGLGFADIVAADGGFFENLNFVFKFIW